MLWGPSGAGKDFLVWGFIRETNNINNDAKKSNIYNYEISKYGNLILPAAQEVGLPSLTASAESLILEFHRKCRQADKKKNPYHFEHFHHVVIHNNRGGELLKVPEGTSEESTITTPFKTADNFVVVMDKPSGEAEQPAEISNSNSLNVGENDLESLINDISHDNNFVTNFQNNTSGQSTRIFTNNKAFYYTKLQQFFNYLNNNKTEGKKHIAICLTKADLHNLEGEPKTVLGELFGEECLNLVNRYEEDYSIKIFLTTTEGFRNPNANTANPTFRNPTNTASPFFWFFEEAEKERLKKNCPQFLVENRERNLTPYPEPKN